MQRTDLQLRAPIFFGEFYQINKRFILIEVGNLRRGELGMLLHPKVIISLSELLDMTAEAVIGQFEGMQFSLVLFLQDGKRTVKILKVSLRE